MERHINESLSYRDLSGRDFSGQEFIECDFRHSKLNGASLERSNFYKTSFEGADLTNATISLNCFMFKDVKFDDEQVDRMLYLLALADISEEKLDAILAIVTERKKNALDRMFLRK